jgi:Ca-activated chloride channel homolog
MQFIYPEYLYALWGVAGLFLFFYWVSRTKAKRLRAFAGTTLYKPLSQSHSQIKEQLKKWLMVLVFIFITLALAQPQWGNVKKEIKRKGIELMFVVDTSLSMLAEDVKPSRIEKAKFIMKSFLKRLEGDRIGIVTFAGSGFVQSPLTLDYDAFLLFANSIEVGYIPDAGTSLTEAINTSVLSFPDSKKKHQAIILLTDGEHHEGDVETVIKAAKESKIRIYTIGLGTKDGAPIPLRSDDGTKSGYKKDRAGEIVITKLNELLLSRIAEETSGLYMQSTPDEREVGWIYDDLKSLDQKEFKQRMISEHEDHFQLFLGFSILLLVLEMLVGEMKKRAKAAE